MKNQNASANLECVEVELLLYQKATTALRSSVLGFHILVLLHTFTLPHYSSEPSF